MRKKIFTYNKKEKLKSRQLFELLFSTGKSFTLFPLKVFYITPAVPANNIVKAGVGAGSRHFKKAVQRNRIKRLLREAYRVNKLPLHHFLQQSHQQLIIFILYIDKQMPQPGIIQDKMPLLVNKLLKNLNENFSAHT